MKVKDVQNWILNLTRRSFLLKMCVYVCLSEYADRVGLAVES